MPAKPYKNSGSRLGIWHHFLDGQPEYLARHYWWAYLWRWGVWFFDHQPIINAILFGQYQTLSHRALHDCINKRPAGRLLQLTCVYGSLTPSLLKEIDDELYLMDVAEIQLSSTRKKLVEAEKARLLCARMNAEYLAYGDNLFATILIFFLLHELPPEARERTLHEVVRVLRPGGRLVITEYGPCPKRHLLWQLWPARVLLEWLEPFLNSFWQQDLAATLAEYARSRGKVLRQVDEFRCFASFYRVCVFELDESSVADIAE
ncbi:MAG: class I SAM-dependent methyltransferase [Gammaproteobacteria bacterium]|nr:class I SAM-dependent methyltransferase [Gammaproteobacteria bacterium]